MITVFKELTNVKEHYCKPIDDILIAIKNGRWKESVDRVRTAPDDIIKGERKKQLPCILFSGEFTERNEKFITKHSGFAIMDFDHVKDLAKFKKYMSGEECVYSAFISPSGDGLKVVIRIPNVIENHILHYNALLKRYNTADPTSINIARVCFASYDPDIYINKEAKVFTDKCKTEIKFSVKPQQKIIDTNKYILRATDIIKNSIDGEKHKCLLRASVLIGGFISGGLVDEIEGIQQLEIAINNKEIHSFKDAQITIRNGVNWGKNYPLYKETYEQRIIDIVNEDIIIENESAKDVIKCIDVQDKILYSYHNGTSRGESTHFPKIDEHFRWKRGEVTLMTGIGNHGKTELMMQLMLMKSIKNGYRWGVFSPESMPVEEFYKGLIHSFVGESPEGFHHNKMSLEKLMEAIKFINEHFFLIYPKDNSPTPKYIINRFRELIIKENIDGCLIDPYNQLDNDITKKNGREDQYLSTFLTDIKRFAVEADIFFLIITHPKTGLIKLKDGNYDCPEVFDLSGGAMWSNKCDNILCTHRPYYTTDKTNTNVLFKSQKIKKQKLNGIPGEVVLDFDREKGRFYQTDGFHPLEEQKYTAPFDNYYEVAHNEKFEIIEDVPF